jgi:hypothetical protein
MYFFRHPKRVQFACCILAADMENEIYSMTGSIKAFGMSDLYGNDTGYGPDISRSNGHNGKAHFIRKDLARSLGIKTSW